MNPAQQSQLPVRDEKGFSNTTRKIAESNIYEDLRNRQDVRNDARTVAHPYRRDPYRPPLHSGDSFASSGTLVKAAIVLLSISILVSILTLIIAVIVIVRVQDHIDQSTELKTALQDANRTLASQDRKIERVLNALLDATTPTPTTPVSDTVRLVNGDGPNSGRVEVLYNGTWGTVCDDDWDLYNAHVVCRMLGFSEALSFLEEAHFGEGTGTIFLNEVQCEGEEKSIWDCCYAKPIGTANCDHSEDVSVICKA